MFFDPQLLAEVLAGSLSFLDKFNLPATTVSHSSHGVTAARRSTAAVYEIRVDGREETVESRILLAGIEGYAGPPVFLDINFLAEIAGRPDRRVRQTDVMKAETLELLRGVIERECANLRDFGLDVLLGVRQSEAVDAVYALLRDIPGDSRFDWWAYRRAQARTGWS